MNNIFSLLKELDAVANELLSEFVVNKIDLSNQQALLSSSANTATNLLYDNNKILLSGNNQQQQQQLHSFNPKLSSSDSSESDSCDEDENGAVRDDGTLQVAHSSKPIGGL